MSSGYTGRSRVRIIKTKNVERLILRALTESFPTGPCRANTLLRTIFVDCTEGMAGTGVDTEDVIDVVKYFHGIGWEGDASKLITRTFDGQETHFMADVRVVIDWARESWGVGSGTALPREAEREHFRPRGPSPVMSRFVADEEPGVWSLDELRARLKEAQ